MRRAEGLRQFCESMAFSYDTGFRAAKSGALRVIYVGRKILVPADEIERVLREGLNIRRGRPPKARAGGDGRRDVPAGRIGSNGAEAERA